jgi:hypothetical protein
LTLEREFGVPTVGIHSAPFARLVGSVTRTKGAPEAPHVFVPQPVSGRSAAELRAYIDGTDAVTGQPLMGRVIDGLISPVTSDRVTHERARPRTLEGDDEDVLRSLFLEQGWTDGLPIVLPTPDRVDAMLAGTSHPADEVVGRIRPALQEAWEYTVEKVAVNAVMAGARPECLPVILALASTGLSARTSSITSMASMAAVNGPIRAELGMNAGVGALGPYNHANATIGRAYGLLSQNLQGGSAPGLTYFGSQGNPMTYATPTFAENEERSPWEPFHVARGFDRTQSTATVMHGVRSVVFRYPIREETWADGLLSALGALELGVMPVLVLDPLAAERFVALGGFTTRSAFANWIAAQATRSPDELWPTFEGHNLLRPRAALGEEPWATHLAAEHGARIPLFKADDVHVLVAGGETLGTYRIFGAAPVVTVDVDGWR